MVDWYCPTCRHPKTYNYSTAKCSNISCPFARDMQRPWAWGRSQFHPKPRTKPGHGQLLATCCICGLWSTFLGPSLLMARLLALPWPVHQEEPSQHTAQWTSCPEFEYEVITGIQKGHKITSRTCRSMAKLHGVPRFWVQIQELLRRDAIRLHHGATKAETCRNPKNRLEDLVRIYKIYKLMQFKTDLSKDMLVMSAKLGPFNHT